MLSTVLGVLQQRADDVSHEAEAIAEAGGDWTIDPGIRSVASLRDTWSVLRERFEFETWEVLGRQDLLRALDATPHQHVRVGILRTISPLPRIIEVYLSPHDDEVVGAIGWVVRPGQPAPVYDRRDLPDTLEQAVIALAGHTYELHIRAVFDRGESERLAVDYTRPRAVYRSAQVEVLGAANVGYSSDIYTSGAEKVGYLLVLDARQTTANGPRLGRIEVILVNARPFAHRHSIPYRYELEDDGSEP